MARPNLEPQPFAPPAAATPRVRPRRLTRALMLDLRPRRFRAPRRRSVGGLLLRIALVPALALAAAAGLVAVGTRPPRTPPALDPTSAGVYFEAVTLMTDDGQRLQGWLVPAVDEAGVLACPRAARALMLTGRHPGVVLAHDFAGSREQMLAYVGPLHDAGCAVLAIDLRGCGESDPAAQTFGLREAADVRAGLDLLRKRNLVDPLRLAAIGLGTGGTAALAVLGDAGVVAAVAVDPPASADAAVAEHLVPDWLRARWTVALVRAVFDTLYTIDSRRLDLERSRPPAGSLVVDRRDPVRRSVAFVRDVVAMRE